MFNGKTFFNIIAAAIGMFLAIVGIAFKTGYWQSPNPNIGYIFFGLGLVITIVFLGKLKS